MLTQKEAWLFLAELWSNAREVCTVWCVDVAGYRNLGICPCITDLERDNRISYTTRTRMMNKILKDWKPTKHSSYRWPLNKEGARQRSLFCLEQANGCVDNGVCFDINSGHG